MTQNEATAEFQGWPQIQDASPHLADGGTTDWSNVGLETMGINGGNEWRDDTGVDTTGNGLYWFWDSIWGEPEL